MSTSVIAAGAMVLLDTNGGEKTAKIFNRFQLGLKHYIAIMLHAPKDSLTKTYDFLSDEPAACMSAVLAILMPLIPAAHHRHLMPYQLAHPVHRKF